MRTRGNTVLITGGSAGIGLAMAKAFSAAGNTVIVCGRNEDRLKMTREVIPGVHTIQCDIADNDERARLLASIQRKFPQLNILVNNAGIMQIYDFVNSLGVSEKIEEEVRTNLLAPVELSSLFLPLLQQQSQAAIVLVSSGLAFVPVANVAVYCATKAALHSFSHSLRHRLKKTSVRVFELLPPPVDTDLLKSLQMPKIQPEKVAEKLLKGLQREHYEIRVGMVRPLRMMSWLAPLFTELMLNKAFSGEGDTIHV